jgi:hypothetical protein
MWMRCAAGQRWDGSGCRGPAARTDWEGASAIAREVNATGSAFFADWRLPRLSELASITQLDCPPPRVDRRMFPDTPPDWFWTDTSRAGEPGGGFAYALSFGSDGVAPISKERMARVRLVRHAD